MNPWKISLIITHLFEYFIAYSSIFYTSYLKNKIYSKKFATNKVCPL